MLLSDPLLWRFMPHVAPGQIDLDHARALIAIAQDRRRHLVRAVIRKGTPVGQVRLHWQGSPKPLASVELDYWLDRHAQGAGVGSRMVALFLWQTLRDFPQLQLVTVVIHRDNAPSRHLARRLGFVESGPKEPGSVWIQACMTRQIAARIDWGGLIRRQTSAPKAAAAMSTLAQS
jgi:RimJ/RimL family protein N-acetyltransferase